MSSPKKTTPRDRSAPQPRVAVSYISDPTAASDDIEFLDQDVIKLGQEPWLARRVTVQLDSALLVFHAATSRTRSLTTLSDQVLAFVAFGPQARGTFNGLELRPELLMAGPPGGKGEFVVEGGYESVTCMIPPSVLQSQLSARGRLDAFEAPRKIEMRKPFTGSCHRFFELGKYLTEAAEQDPKLLEDSERVRAGAQVDLIETLLEIVCSSEDPELTARDRTQSDYSEIVKRAQDRALRDLDERCYVADLCEASGVSERTLQYAFQSIVSMTPIGYLRQIRLHRARKVLREAAPDSTTVTEVALDWGFPHFGEFSQAYKNCFGELPSETLNGKIE